MNYGLTQLNFKQLLDCLDDHPDVRIVTDIKGRNLEGLAYIAKRAGDAQRQFIPQIYTVNEYDRVIAIGFQNIVFTLYRSAISDSEVLGFFKNNLLVALTLPINRAINSSLALDLKARGVFVYAHTVNQAEVYEYLQDKRIGGIYSDKLFPAEWRILI